MFIFCECKDRNNSREIQIKRISFIEKVTKTFAKDFQEIPPPLRQGDYSIVRRHICGVSYEQLRHQHIVP